MKREGKKEQVRNIFISIYEKYDFLNHLLSLGIDIYWRKQLVKKLKKNPPSRVLDIATGTGDLAISISKAVPEATIIGADISEKMLEVGQQKVEKKNLGNRIKMELGDSEKLKYNDGFFDAVTVAFGVRNYENLDKGLKEMNRVTKANGFVYVLEFSKPTMFPVKQLYKFYFSSILPLLGKSVSKNNSAYTYLPESVQKFPDGEKFLKHLQSNGYLHVKQIKFTFGISTLYIGQKPPQTINKNL